MKKVNICINIESNAGKIIPCGCGGNFDTEYAITLLYMSNLNALTKSANERLYKIIDNHCMICGSRQSSGDIVKQPKIVIKETDNKAHTICKICAAKAKANTTEYLKSNKSATAIPLKCHLCEKQHLCDLKSLRLGLKSGDNACCLLI
jgi:transcription elongation factor Elf1